MSYINVINRKRWCVITSFIVTLSWFIPFRLIWHFFCAHAGSNQYILLCWLSTEISKRKTQLRFNRSLFMIYRKQFLYFTTRGRRSFLDGAKPMKFLSYREIYDSFCLKNHNIESVRTRTKITRFYFDSIYSSNNWNYGWTLKYRFRVIWFKTAAIQNASKLETLERWLVICSGVVSVIGESRMICRDSRFFIYISYPLLHFSLSFSFSFSLCDNEFTEYKHIIKKEIRNKRKKLSKDY